MSGEPQQLTKTVRIIGEIIEHLRLGKQEWLTIRLGNNQVITINKKLCEEIKDDQSAHTNVDDGAEKNR